MVNVNCTGGGGYFSDDVSATKANVVKGKQTVTKDSNDEVIEGTMVEVGAADAQKSNSVANNNLYLRMTNGAHRTKNQTSGFPEVYIPLQTLRSQIGATDASKILTGTTIAGLAGTMPNRGAWNGTLTLSGSITIPQGWHNGSGKISRSYSTYGGGTFTPSATNQTIPTAGKILTGDVKCAANANIIAQNIRHGVTIMGVTGQLNGVTHVAYNGSSFSGMLAGGMRTGIVWRDTKGVDGIAYNVQSGSLDGYSDNSLVTSGPLTVSTKIPYSDYYVDPRYMLMTQREVDLTAFSKMSITQTGDWYGKGLTTSNGHISCINTSDEFYVMKYSSEHDSYVPENRYSWDALDPIEDISREETGTSPGYNGVNGQNRTTWTKVYDLSKISGYHYLCINYYVQNDQSINVYLSNTINEIKFYV